MNIDAHRLWFEDYVGKIERGEVEPPPRGLRYPCPSCGYPMLEERNKWEGCSLCDWEDDGQDDPHADEVWGGPNYSYSLSEARENFKRYLIKFQPDRRATRTGGNSNTPAQDQAKRVIIQAFQRMVGEKDQQVLDRLWQQVYDNEWVLESELYRIVHEYEERMTGKTQEYKEGLRANLQ